MVSQVPVVAILMIVHGTLVALLGGLYAVLGPLMLVGGQMSGDSKDQAEMSIFGGIFAGCGLLGVVIGALNFVAGIRCLRLRGRILALTAIFSNVIVLPTGYCAVTGLAVMIYGLIVFFQSDVVRAFAMVAAGATPEEAKEAFDYRRRYSRYDDDRYASDDYFRERRRDYLD